MTVVVDSRGQPATNPCSGEFCFVNDVISWRFAASSELAKCQQYVGSFNGQELNDLRQLSSQLRDPSVVLGRIGEAVNYFATIAQGARNLWEPVFERIEAGKHDPNKGDDDGDDGGSDWEIPKLPDFPNIPSIEIPSFDLGNFATIALAALGIVGFAYAWPLRKKMKR